MQFAFHIRIYLAGLFNIASATHHILSMKIELTGSVDQWLPIENSTLLDAKMVTISTNFMEIILYRTAKNDGVNSTSLLIPVQASQLHHQYSTLSCCPFCPILTLLPHTRSPTSQLSHEIGGQ